MAELSVLSCEGLLDLATFGLVANSAHTLPSLRTAIRVVLTPALSPTTDIIDGRGRAALHAGHIDVDPSDGLKLTEAGWSRLRDLLRLPQSSVPHDLAPTCEALKLAFIDRFELADQRFVHEDILAARAHCVAEQTRALRACEAQCPVTASCRRYQLALAITGFEHLRAALVRKREPVREDETFT